MNLDALRSLQEQASPGPWAVRHGPYDVWGGDGAWFGILHASCQLDMGDGSPNPSLEEQAPGRVANAKLAALVPHLLPLAEALEEIEDAPLTRLSMKYKLPEWMAERATKALKALQEALE